MSVILPWAVTGWLFLVGAQPAFTTPAWWDKDLVAAGYAQAPPTGCYFLKEIRRPRWIGVWPSRTKTVLCFSRPEMTP